MQEFISYLSDMLSEVCGFLLSEPIIWFVGCAVLLFVVKIFFTIANLSIGGK